MQKHEFESGGYCVYKITIPGSNRTFSAWFNAAGELIDAEARDRRGACRPALRMNAPRQCEYLNRVYGGKKA